MAKYSSILFDLDGNLLPMDMDNFINLYFGALAQYMVPYGFEPKEFIDGIWAGTKAMIKNDGTMANEERFWNTFAEKLGKRVFDYVFTIDSFYTTDFNKAKAATWENPNAIRAVEAARKIADNMRDLADCDKDAIAALHIIPCRELGEVLANALTNGLPKGVPMPITAGCIAPTISATAQGGTHG